MFAIETVGLMRPLQEVQRVMELAEAGHSKRAISTRTGISRAVIREWLSDPEKVLARRQTRPEGGFQECRGLCQPWRELDPNAYAYLLGMYLGDGYIVRYPRTFRFSVSCDNRYEGIVSEVAAAIQAVQPGRKVALRKRQGVIQVEALSCHWPCFFPQHGPGMKHTRSIVLQSWQQAIVDRHPKSFLRGLLHSDGCRVVNRVKRPVAGQIKEYTYVRYFFTNTSEHIKRIFCETCDRLGIRYKTSPGARDVSINRRDDIAYLDTFVGPKR